MPIILEDIATLNKGDVVPAIRGKIIHVGEWIEEEDRFREGEYTSKQYVVLADPEKKDGAVVGCNFYGHPDLARKKFHVIELFAGKHGAVKCDNYTSRDGTAKTSLKVSSSADIEDHGDAQAGGGAPRRDDRDDRDRREEPRREAPRDREEPRRPAPRPPKNGKGVPRSVREDLARIANLAALCNRQALITRSFEYQATGVIKGACSLAASIRIDALKRVNLSDIPVDIREIDLTLPKGVLSPLEQARLLAEQDAEYEARKNKGVFVSAVTRETEERPAARPAASAPADDRPQYAETGDGPPRDRPIIEEEEDDDIPF